jgi:aryl-alcohol dehydrogenase-like predicted oxidoreductase
MAAFLPENLERARPLMNELREVARRHDATPAQVALAWVARHPNVVVIPGASTVAQVEANAEAAELEISDDEAGQLLAAAETYEPVAGAAALGRVIGERAKTLFTH